MSTVSGTGRVGGLVGQNGGNGGNAGTTLSNYGDGGDGGTGTITNSYSTGAVSGNSYVGGLVGKNYGSYGHYGQYGTEGEDGVGTVTGCYWDVNTSGKTNWAGDPGLGGGVTGLTTLQWLTQGPITQNLWDMTNTWLVGYPYPVLKSLPYVLISASGTQVYGDTSSLNVTPSSITDQNGNNASSQVNTSGMNWLSSSSSNVGSATFFGGTGATVSGGYQLTYNGTLTITPRNITVTANASKVYGDVNPTSGGVTLTAGSLVGSDALGSADLSSTATTTSNIGDYTLTPSGVSFTSGNASNYNISYANGTLTITPRNITVTANASKVYGDANPTSGGVTLTAGSLVGSDALGSADLSSTATTTSNIGDYTLTPSGVSFTSGNASNYNVTYVNGKLRVSPACLTVTANNATKYSGQTNPAFTASYSGLANSDTPASLSGKLTFDTAATRASGPGTYVITLTGTLSSPNYSISYGNGVLTVTGRAADPAYDGAVIQAEQIAFYLPSSGYMADAAGTYVPLTIRGSGTNISGYVPWSGLDNFGQTDD